MNILFVNDIPFNPTLGGIERVTDILAKFLMKRGYGIYYLSGFVDSPEMLAYEFPVQMHTLPVRGLFNHIENYNYYINFIKENNIDIIINQRGLDLRFKKLLDVECVKKISVLHSTPHAPYRMLSKIFYKSANFIDLIKNIVKFLLFPLILQRNRKRAYKLISKHYNYLSDNSNAIVLLSFQYKKEFLEFNIKKKETPIFGIPNPNTFYKQDVDLEEKEKIILFVGRLEAADKNPIQLLKVWKRIYRNHLDWKLVFVGDGTELNRMQRYITINRLLNVQFVGNQKDVMKYYKISSIVCLTSKFEGWPMSLTEGMTCGCIPFVFNSFAAAADIIDDGVNGHIIKSFDIKEYANKLSALMENKIQRINMATEAQLKVSEFDINNIGYQWEKIINKNK